MYFCVIFNFFCQSLNSRFKVGNSRGNSYTKFAILDITFRFTFRVNFSQKLNMKNTAYTKPLNLKA